MLIYRVGRKNYSNTGKINSNEISFCVIVGFIESSSRKIYCFHYTVFLQCHIKLKSIIRLFVILGHDYQIHFCYQPIEFLVIVLLFYFQFLFLSFLMLFFFQSFQSIETSVLVFRNFSMLSRIWQQYHLLKIFISSIKWFTHIPSLSPCVDLLTCLFSVSPTT